MALGYVSWTFLRFKSFNLVFLIIIIIIIIVIVKIVVQERYQDIILARMEAFYSTTLYKYTNCF